MTRTGGPRRLLRRWLDEVVLPHAQVLAAALTVCLALTVVDPGHPPPGAPVTAVPAGGGQQLDLGVTVFTMWRDWEHASELLERARGAGVGWVRVDMGWCSLEERGPGQVSLWYQGRLDVTAETAERLGMKLLVQVGCAPRWAGGNGFNSYPDDPAQFERVTRYLADRYRGRVAAWEIGNEPNCVGGCFEGSPQRYVQLLRAGYRGVKAADPAATVVSGGTSGNDVAWLERLYAAGAHGLFDALAVHPYQDPADAPPDAPSDGAVYRLSTLPRVHELMVGHGDGDKPIWLTEFGWTTASTGERPGVDRPTQARYLTQAVARIRREYPWVTHAFWYCMRDRDDWTPYENEFGLLDLAGEPKPAYAALREAVASAAASR